MTLQQNKESSQEQKPEEANMFENTPSSEKKIFLFEILSPNDMITEFLRVCVTFLQEVYFDLTH